MKLVMQCFHADRDGGGELSKNEYKSHLVEHKVRATLAMHCAHLVFTRAGLLPPRIVRLHF